jgi:hypothetical protein
VRPAWREVRRLHRPVQSRHRQACSSLKRWKARIVGAERATVESVG